MSRTLALFDLDHTLLPLDSDQSWARFYATLGFEGSADHAEEIDAYYQQYVAGTLDMNAYLGLTLAPLAFALGQGSEMQQPLAIAIISGLIVQLPLVLLAMPVLYSVPRHSSRTLRSEEDARQ